MYLWLRAIEKTSMDSSKICKYKNLLRNSAVIVYVILKSKIEKTGCPGCAYLFKEKQQSVFTNFQIGQRSCQKLMVGAYNSHTVFLQMQPPGSIITPTLPSRCASRNLMIIWIRVHLSHDILNSYVPELFEAARRHLLVFGVYKNLLFIILYNSHGDVGNSHKRIVSIFYLVCCHTKSLLCSPFLVGMFVCLYNPVMSKTLRENFILRWEKLRRDKSIVKLCFEAWKKKSSADWIWKRGFAMPEELFVDIYNKFF